MTFSGLEMTLSFFLSFSFLPASMAIWDHNFKIPWHFQAHHRDFKDWGWDMSLIWQEFCGVSNRLAMVQLGELNILRGCPKNMRTERAVVKNSVEETIWNSEWRSEWKLYRIYRNWPVHVIFDICSAGLGRFVLLRWHIDDCASHFSRFGAGPFRDRELTPFRQAKISYLFTNTEIQDEL